MPDDPTDIGDRPQHEFVNRHRRSPSDAAPRAVTLVGFLADSERPGFRRIYFSRALDDCAEFQTKDVIEVDDLAANQYPFLGAEGATVVMIAEGANVEFVQARTSDDVFTIDIIEAKRPTFAGPQRQIFEGLSDVCVSHHVGCDRK
jgi:hypothetical protein